MYNPLFRDVFIMELRPYAIINKNKERGPPYRKPLPTLISYIGQSLTRIKAEAELMRSIIHVTAS